MDAYEAIISGMPTQNSQAQAALVQALRRRRSMGDLGQLTGDRVMAPMGQGLSRQADADAGMLQQQNWHNADDAQTKAYQDSQIAHMDRVLKETIANNARQDATARRGQDLDLEAAKFRAANSGGKPARLRQGDITFLRDNAQAISSTNRMLEFLDKGGNLGAVGGIPLVGSVLRQSANKAATYGMGTKDSKETALMWQNYKRFYDLAERNNLFGATLTPNEQRAWAQANPAVTQDDKQIREGLKIMQKVYSHSRDSMVSGLKDEGYSEDAINEYSKIQTLAPDDRPKAPQAALDFLKANPQTLPQFIEQFGYYPRGR